MDGVEMAVAKRDVARLLGLAEPACPADEELVARLRREIRDGRNDIVAIQQIDLRSIKPDDIPY
ncbi:MAG TPA: hypothetical protein VF503_20540 [Sphingobium sp.]|uniref:hypothetical protein n=1 Tax=Sphingobium sp. TaxID=1912891 RepID=UPI002ED4DBBF